MTNRPAHVVNALLEGFDAYDYIASSPPPPGKIIRTSFARATPESVQDGDYSETGWIDEEGASMEPDDFDMEEGLTPVDLAVKFLKGHYAHEPSSTQFYPGVWYSSGWETTDYGTGEEEQQSFHLSGFDEDEEREIFTRMRN